jgi:hypothetical protein
MILTSDEKQKLVEKMPYFELSYDNVLHKKVPANFFMIIPKGKKSLIWFTFYKTQNVCFVLELDSNNNINNIYSISYSFDNELAYNTILHGTLVKVDSSVFFTCEDVLFYKNKDVQNKSFSTKLNIMRELFENDIKNTVLFKNNFFITIPVIKTDFNTAFYQSQYLQYQPHGILCRTEHNSIGINIIKNENIEVIFKVKADLNQDIYNLYCENDIYTGVAMIPDYKTSVFMNSLFRTIKENTNLDLLEESDEEDEFENVSEDKFVDLNKVLLMKCVYMHRFKKWKPLLVVPTNSKVITKRELYEISNRQIKKYK